MNKSTNKIILGIQILRKSKKKKKVKNLMMNKMTSFLGILVRSMLSKNLRLPTTHLSGNAQSEW